jgi:hypothetical protein
LLVVIALVIAAPFVFRRAMTAYRTLQARTVADRRLRSYFKQCLAYSQSDASPIFDEARDTCPIDLDSCSGQGISNRKYIRFRGDPGLAWQYGVVPPGHRHAVFEAWTMLWKLAELNSETASRIRVAHNHLGNLPFVLECSSGHSCTWPETYELFIHGRSTPGGPERLVGVMFDATMFLAGDPNPLSIRVYSSPRPMLQGCGGHGNVGGLGLPSASSEPLRLFAGQPDPVDSSHFTIRYSAGKRHGVIDAWLRRDDSVALSAHDLAP